MRNNYKEKLRFLWKIYSLICTLFVTVVLLGASLAGIRVYDVIPPNLSETQSWRGITPGQTTLQEALAIMGEGVAEYRQSGYAYTFHSVQETRWRTVELWTEDRNSGRIVIAILFDNPADFKGREDTKFLEFHSLGQFAEELGEPTFVSWTSAPFERAPIWSQDGILVIASANFIQEDFKQSDAEITGVLLFEPMGLRKMLRSIYSWPWPKFWSITQNDMHANRLDTYGRDPYDWSVLTHK